MFDYLDDTIADCEAYLDDNGLPFCDYTLYRTRKINLSPLKKFQHGVK
jgi:hypothetical protein